MYPEITTNGFNNYKTKTNKIPPFRKVLPQLLAVTAKNILLLSYGMTIGFPTIAIPSLSGDRSRPGNENELVLNKDQISWISSINLLTVPLGCLLSGVATQPLGRKRSMQLVNIPFIAAWLLFHYGRRVELLYLALCITGFTGGLLEAPVLTYVAEITQPYLRGMLSATSTMSIILGVFIQFLFGTFLNWRVIALINIVFPISAFFALFFVPESPHWLILKNRHQDAKKSLCWLRGWCSEEHIIPEFNEIYATIYKLKPQGDKKVNTFHLADYKKKTFLMPYFLVCFAFFVGHFSGMTNLQTYAVPIFEKLKAPMDKYYATLLLGIVELLGTLICVFLVHYLGKRLLTFFSTIGCSICFLTVGIYAFSIGVNEQVGTTVGSLTAELPVKDNLTWIPTTFLIAAAFLSHCCIRLLPWILIGEVFTTETRANASGLAGGAGYIFGFLANKLFYQMVTVFTWSGIFIFYGCMGLLGTVVLYFILPETEGKPLGEIELHFAGIEKLRKSVRRKTHQVPAKSSNGVAGIPENIILETENNTSKL